MDNSLMTLGKIPLTKAAQAQLGQRWAEQLLDAGEQSPLDALIQLRALKAAVDSAIATMESEAMDEAERYGKGDNIRFGVQFTTRSGAPIYDYGSDLKWAHLVATERATVELRKAREQFLRSLTEEVADMETGEIITPAELTGYRKSSLALTFPKE